MNHAKNIFLQFLKQKKNQPDNGTYFEIGVAVEELGTWYPYNFLGIGKGGSPWITKQSIYNQFYSDLVTKIQHRIDVPGTTIHVFYATKMGKKNIQCLSPAKKYKLYKSSINKSIHFVQRSLSSSTRGQRVTAQLNLSRE